MLKQITTLLLFFFLSFLQAQAQDNYKWSAVKKGESFNAFLKRNNLNPKTQSAEFRKLNKGRFTKSGHLIAGKKYKIPSKNNISTLSLFGKKYAKVKIKDRQLHNAVLYLVAGHGGPDPGAIGKVAGHRICEDEYAYDIVLRLGRELISHGAKVHFIIQDKNDGIRDDAFLTPDKDEVCYPNKTIPLKQLKRLKQRTLAINDLAKKTPSNKYQRVIILHLDSRSKRKKTDVFFYHHSKSKRGKATALTLLKTMDEKYAKHQPNRDYTGTVGSRRLYIIRKTNPPAVFIELGNINNYRDQVRFTATNNRQALANWLCEGIIADYKKHKR